MNYFYERETELWHMSNSIVHMQNTKPQTLINGPLYQINALLEINEMCTMIAHPWQCMEFKKWEKRLLGFYQMLQLTTLILQIWNMCN